MGLVTFTTHIQELGVDSDVANFSNIELSNASGERGFVSGGIASTTTTSDAIYKKFQVKVTTALSGAATGVTLTQALASVYTTHNTLTVQVTPAGNAVVAAGTSANSGELSAADKTAEQGAVLDGAAEVEFSLSSTGDQDTWVTYFVAGVRPNNEWGVEVGGIDGETGLPLTAYNGVTDYKQGDVCSNGGKNWVYKNATHGSGHAAETGDYWQEARLHSLDGITSTIKEANDA